MELMQGALLIPRRWREVLMRLKQSFPEAIIAGGALRDLLHGREIKDVDLWVIDRGGDTKLTLDMALGVTTTKLEGDNADYENTTAGRFDIYEFTDGGAWKFQIMTMTSEHADTFTWDTVSRFDIGLCHIWSEDGVSIQADDHYRRDAAAKTLTIVYIPNSGAYERSRIRQDRLLKKYPDFAPAVRMAFDIKKEVL